VNGLDRADDRHGALVPLPRLCDKASMITAESGPFVVTAAQMRAAEAAAIAAGIPALTLMERAAAAAARAILAHHPAARATILCGPGNNGGDGWGIACHLSEAGVEVTVAADAPPASEPAATMARRWTGSVVPLQDAPPAPLLIDALFGTGLVRPLSGPVQAALDRLRGHAADIVAVDIVSGIHADTGAALGRPLPATRTISFAAAKPGHVLGAGGSLAGVLEVMDIGVPLASQMHLTARPHLGALPHDTHKHARGHVLVVEGASGGAAGLAGVAALRTGAGLVTIAGDGTALPALALMRRADAAAFPLLADPRLKVVVIGPGMDVGLGGGLDGGARGRDWLRRLLGGKRPLVIDAGALALLDGGPIGAPAVLTPHEGEFVRLFGPIGADRIAAVQAAARAVEAVVLLKGPASIIAAPDGRVAINAHASPFLATAGSGDVLAGMIGSLMAQGLGPFEAAQAAAWLHGEAGRRLGPGGIADDLVGLIPAVLASL
jgi:hydroxyethylthiazole kinase-like uncharacterized protein yjeF